MSTSIGKTDYLRAWQLAEVGKYREAEAFLKKSANKKHGPAFYAIANWYIHGIFYKKDYRKAYFFLQEAIRHGDTTAHYDLAVSYEKGLGIRRNYAKAARRYLLAAKYKDKTAYSEVARIYYWGMGGRKTKKLPDITTTKPPEMDLWNLLFIWQKCTSPERGEQRT